MSARACLRACALVTGLALAAPPGAEPLSFDWPVPSTVAVKASTDRRGDTSTAHYRVELGALDGGDLALAFRDFELLTLNGADARSPELAAKLGPLTALTAALPTMRLSPGGKYLGTVGLEQMMARVFALLPDDMDPAVRERLERYYRSEEMQRTMQQKSGDVWNVWVGAWNGLDLAAGESQRFKVPITVLGRTLEQAGVIEHLGAAPDTCAGCVRLRLTTLIEGPEVVAMLSGVVRELAPAGGEAGQAEFEYARSTTVAEVVTEAERLRPHYASTTTEVALRDSGGADHRRTDRKEYWFQWR